MTIGNSLSGNAADWINPGQCGLYRGAEIGVSEPGPAQPQPGGEALQEYAAFLGRQRTGRGHDQGKLSIVEGKHGQAVPRRAVLGQS